MDDAGTDPLAGLDATTRAVQSLINAGNELAARQARALGSTVNEVRALFLLESRGPVGIAELAGLLGITANATTALVDRLASSGHADREIHPGDRRRIVVRLRPGARDRGREVWLPSILAVDEICHALTAEERRTVITFLRRVVESMDLHGH